MPKVKSKSKTKPKKTKKVQKRKSLKKVKGLVNAFAFFVQDARKTFNRNHPNEKVPIQIFNKRCSAKWQSLNEEEKAPFKELAAIDKRRYDSEKLVTTSSRKKKVKKTNKTARLKFGIKKPLSPFFCFAKFERKNISSSHPDWSISEIAKELGLRWHSITEDQKNKYKKMAEEEKIRYENELFALKN